MGDFTPYIFIILFGAAVFVDLFGHYKRGLYRKRFDNTVLAVYFVLLGFSILAALAMREAAGPSDVPGQYVAYQYLLDNDPESAMGLISEDADMSEAHRSLLKIMAEAEAGDHEELFFDSSEYLDRKGIDAGLRNIVKQLNELSVKALNGSSVNASGITRLVKEAYTAAGIRESEELKTLYRADRDIRSGNAGNVSASGIEGLLTEFGGYDVVQKIAMSYYLTLNDYDSAAGIARDLIEQNGTEANYVLYTDVLAQAAYAEESETLAEGTDGEIAPLVERALTAYDDAMAANGTDINTIEKNVEKAEDYYDEARGVIYQRLINFLELKKQQGYDRDGYIALEMMKLRLLKKDYETARENLTVLLDRIERLETTSPIRDDLIRLREALDTIEEKDARSGSDEYLSLCKASSELLNNASCMVFSYGEDNINGRASRITAAMLYCGLPKVEITGSDTSKYPKTGIDFSLNVQKKNIIGGPGEYYADDFTFTDMEEPVNDCKITALNGYDGRSCVFVPDLQNRELTQKENDELKDGLYRLTDEARIAEGFAFVNSTSYIQSELTDDTEKVRYAIRNINTQYAVSAYTCLNTALDTLSGIRSEEEGVILYITNGSSLSEEELLQIVNLAVSRNVRVCALSVGSEEDAVTDALCRATGGINMHVPYYDQLCVFSDELSKLMNYRYTASFTAENYPEVFSERTFTVTLNELGIGGSITYAGGGS